MKLAITIASRATCDRKRVGALIVRDRIILSTGYNGSMRSLPHCDDVGHTMEEGHCITTVHAESNAIAQAARMGIKLEGSSLYTTASPCWTCFKLIVQAGIQEIYYGEFYRDERTFAVAESLGIAIIYVQPC
jgi:dCMP deaminase